MRTLLISSLIGAALLGCATPTPAPPPAPVQLKILAINDFHGNLKPPLGGIRIQDPADATKTVNVPAGGAEHLATALDELRAKNPNHIFVAAGDLIGASPLLSALFHDEPTVEALSAMGLAVSAVGNHEFDKGAAELLRLQNGGCSAADGCKGPRPFAGAKFQYLAASTVVQATGRTLLPAYVVKRFQGVPVAFIGLTLKETPTIVVPSGVAGLTFRDEAETVNELVPVLQQQGVQAIVLLIHEGGFPSGDYNECPGISGAIVDIVKKLDKAVALVVSGHTHRAYNCRIDGRLVTSGDKYGTIVTQIDVTLDPASGRITNAVADNVIVRTDRFAKQPALTELIAGYERLAVPLARRVVGRIGGALSREVNAAGESPLGQVIADAQLAATKDLGAQLALMNPGGVRADLGMPADGLVRYEDLFAVQPFYNNLVTMTLSGAQLLQVLEQQWLNQPRPRLLHVSRGFSYTWDASRPPGRRVVPGSVRLDGQPVVADSRVRVTVNAFMAAGGDNFMGFKAGTDSRTGMMDVDALELFVKNNPALAPGAPDRITRLN
jgi:5'-nucleotidase